MEPKVIALFALFNQLKVLRADLGQANNPGELAPFTGHFHRILRKARELLGEYPPIAEMVADPATSHQQESEQGESPGRTERPLAVSREALLCDMGSLLAALESYLHLICTVEEKRRIGFTP